MDERKIGSAPNRVISHTEQPAADSRTISVGSGEIRIDGAHAPSNIEQHAQSTPPSPPAAVASSRGNSQLLLEAGRIVEQMQAQMADLDEREARLQQQLAEFETEQCRFQSSRSEEESRLETRRLKLASDEAAFAHRLTESQELLARIDANRAAVEEARVEIERRRISLRDEILLELQHERHEIEEQRRDVTTEFGRARALTEALEEQRRAATEEAERSVQSERERLWQTLITEWEERRNQFQAEHDEWLAKSQAERLEIERERAFYEAAVRNAESDFAAAREAQAIELQTIRDQTMAALQAKHAELQVRIRSEQAEWEQRLASQQSEFLAVRQQHSAAIEAERAEWEQSRTNQQAEFLAAGQKHAASIAAERDEWEQTRSAELTELHSERAVLENRIRFQQEHLEKLRSDLDRAQNKHRRQRQIEQQRLEDENRQLLRRMRQIDLYRTSIDEREKSLERERDVLQKSRRAFSSTADLNRLNLQAERNAWTSERQIQQAELLKQQELYTTHADSLESRRIRLDRLRTELEDTHRSTLEMRLAVEEAWVGLTQDAGQEEARQRVEEVRNSLVGYYHQLHEGIVEQRREHLEAQTKFERLRAEFHDERRKLMEWISSRDQELRIAEERLRISSSEAATRDAAWQAERDRWMMEKAEAEQVIRKLLGELGNQHRDPLAGTESLTRNSATAVVDLDSTNLPTRPLSQMD